MSFAAPFALLSLLAVPVLAVLAVAARRRRARYPVAFTNLGVLATVAQPRRTPRRWVPTALVLLALAFAATAMAKPRLETTVPDSDAVVVLLVDVSGSMQSNDIAPSRIDAAVNAMKTFVAKLPNGAAVGLVEFSTDPTTVELPTSDHSTVLDAIDLLTPEGATAIGDGIATAVQDVQIGLAATGAARKYQARSPAAGAIVLLSDGAQNRGTLQPLQAAHERAGRVRIYTVAFGTPNGKVRYEGYPTAIPVPPDPATMRAVAGHGREVLHGPDRKPGDQHLLPPRLYGRPHTVASGGRVVVGTWRRAPTRRGRRRRGSGALSVFQ